MPTPASYTEDVRKLHAEVTQIVNQRILIASLATTIVGGVIASTLPKDISAGASVQLAPYIASIALFAVLFSLALLSHILRRQLRIISTCLEVIYESAWESHWSSYRDEFNYPGYTKPLAWYFLALGLVSLFYPFIISSLSTGSGLPIVLRISPVIMFFFYGLTVYGLGISSGKAQDAKCRENWKWIKEKNTKAAPAGEA